MVSFLKSIIRLPKHNIYMLFEVISQRDIHLGFEKLRKHINFMLKKSKKYVIINL